MEFEVLGPVTDFLGRWIHSTYVRARGRGAPKIEPLVCASVRECPPEDVRVDLAGADESSVVCQSLPGTDPYAHGKVSPAVMTREAS
jgi:hypothetical protein